MIHELTGKSGRAVAQSYATDTGFNTQSSENDPVRSALYGTYPKERTIYCAILGYCILHFLIRLITSPVLTLDEANFALLGQSFQLGYSADHPPLLTWFFAILNATLGMSVASIAALKYTLFAVGLCAYYKASLTVFEWMDNDGFLHRRLDLAAGSVGALALIFALGWAGHEDKIPQILDFTTLSITLYFLTNALTNKGYFWWGCFGASMGLCALSHLHLVLFPFCLICAAMGMKSLTRPHYDANGDRLSPPAITWIRVGVALAAGLVVFTLHGMWLLQGGGPVSSLSASDFGFGPKIIFTTQDGIKDFVLGRGLSLRASGLSAIEFIMPLGILFLMLFWPMWFAYIYPFFPKRDVEEGPFERTWRRLFSYTLRLSLIILCLTSIATGHSLSTPWMLPAFMALPIWLFFQVQRSGPYFIAMKAFGVVVGLSIILVIAGRFVDWSEDIMGCAEIRCRAYQPIEEFSKSLTLEGFADGTIVGNEPHLTGNLRTQFPDARMIDLHYPLAAFPVATNGRGACLAIWREQAAMPEELVRYLKDNILIKDVSTAPQGAVRKNLINSREKHSILYYRFLKPNKNCK